MAAQNTSEIRAQLVAEFGDTPGFSDAFASQCACPPLLRRARSNQAHDFAGITVCNNYHISGQDLFYKWEASLVGDLPRIIHDKTVANIISVVKSDLERAERLRKPRANPAMVLRGKQRIPFLNKTMRGGQKLGLIPADIPSEPSSSTPRGTAKRSESVKVTFELDKQPNTKHLCQCPPSRVTSSDKSITIDKYMYEKVSERSASKATLFYRFASSSPSFTYSA